MTAYKIYSFTFTIPQHGPAQYSCAIVGSDFNEIVTRFWEQYPTAAIVSVTFVSDNVHMPVMD